MNDRILELTTLVTRNTGCACVYHKHDHSISFDESSAGLLYISLCILSLVAALVLWFTGTVLHIGSVSLPWWVFLFPALACLVMVFLFSERSGFMLMLPEQELRYGKVRIPFAALQHERLLLKETAGGSEIWINHPDLQKRLCSFDKKDAALARQCYGLLEYVLHRHNAQQELASQQLAKSSLTPVQHWIMGACAIFARVNYFPVDRLGDAVLVKSLTRKKLLSMLERDWGVNNRETLLENINSLLDYGHRNEIAHSHRIAAMLPEQRQEYTSLLKQLGNIASKGALFPEHALSTGGIGEAAPFRRLVQLRYGPEGENMLDAILEIEGHFKAEEKGQVLLVELHLLKYLSGAPQQSPGEVNWEPVLEMVAQEAGEEAAKTVRRYRYWFDSLVAVQPGGVALFMEIEGLWLTMQQDQDFFQEEINRVAMLTTAPAEGQPADERYLIWDYTRILMLYRWGYMLDWLDEHYCWEHMLPLAQRIQQHYSSWQDMAEAYLEGRQLWAGGMAEGMERFNQAVKELHTDPLSPWKLAEWNMPLVKDWKQEGAG